MMRFGARHLWPVAVAVVAATLGEDSLSDCLDHSSCATVALLQSATRVQAHASRLGPAEPSGSATAAATAPPSFVVVLLDDLGRNAFNIYGDNDVTQAPAVAELMKLGVVLDRHYTFHSCGPSRASLLTGRVPGHGIWNDNPEFMVRTGVNLDARMLPAMLKRAGYKSHHIGKWHQGFYNRSYIPAARGFDTSFGYFAGNQDAFTQCAVCGSCYPELSTEPTSCARSFCNRTCPQEGLIDLWRDDRPAYGENGTYNAMQFANEAVKVIESNDGSPMFMYLALAQMHFPFEAPEEFLRDVPPGFDAGGRTLQAMLLATDRVLANVTAALKRKGMFDNTIILFMGDNGGTFEWYPHSPHPDDGSEPRNWKTYGVNNPSGSSNYPLRGYKYSLFEGGIRTAAIIASPLLPQELQGTRSSTMLHISDWYVTFCRLAGLTDCSDGLTSAPLDGVDAWQLLLSGESQRPASTWSGSGGPRAGEIMISTTRGNSGGGVLLSGEMKLLVGLSPTQTLLDIISQKAPGTAVTSTCISDGWSPQYPGMNRGAPQRPRPKEVHSASLSVVGSFCTPCWPRPCLFNLTADLSEENDLSSSHLDILEAMVTRFHELDKAMDVPNGPVFSKSESAFCSAIDSFGGFVGPWE